MPRTDPKRAGPTRVVYLFGAGATHAELASLQPTLPSEDKELRKLGLLITHVSARVIQKASLIPRFLKGAEFLAPRYTEGVELTPGTSGSQNIELLISLIENSKIHDWEWKSRLLRDSVQKDIETILSPTRCSRFYLHRALFELHTRPKVIQQEQLLGIISLNYDNVLDQAYEKFFGKQNYCFSLEADSTSSDHIPLLKLHGSFDWKSGVTIRRRKKRIDTIPLGSNKNYLHPPYNFIWNRALEILIGCDTLRVIGCSLSQNDSHLVDLLFKAHLERDPNHELNIEVIDSEAAGERIRNNYGFFLRIRTLTTIDENLVAASNPSNAFMAWLIAKSDRALGQSIDGTRYLKKLKG